MCRYELDVFPWRKRGRGKVARDENGELNGAAICRTLLPSRNANGIKFRNETLTRARSTKANLKIRDTARPPRIFDKRPNLILVIRAVPPLLPHPPPPRPPRLSRQRIAAASLLEGKSLSLVRTRDEVEAIFFASPGNGGGNDNDAVGKVFEAESPSLETRRQALANSPNPTTSPGENWKSMDRSLDMLYTIFFLTARQPVCALSSRLMKVRFNVASSNPPPSFSFHLRSYGNVSRPSFSSRLDSEKGTKVKTKASLEKKFNWLRE